MLPVVTVCAHSVLKSVDWYLLLWVCSHFFTLGMNDAHHFMPFNRLLTHLVVLMANSCRLPAASKGFGLLGGEASVFDQRKYFKVFRVC